MISLLVDAEWNPPEVERVVSDLLPVPRKPQDPRGSISFVGKAPNLPRELHEYFCLLCYPFETGLNIVPAVCGGDHEFLADGDEVRDAALDVNLEGEREDERRDELLEEELVRLPLHAGPRGGGVDLLVEGLDVGGNDDVVDDQVALRGLNGNENESDVERLNKKRCKILTTTQIMDESGRHCASTFSPSSSIDSGGLRWLMMGTQGFTYLRYGIVG